MLMPWRHRHWVRQVLKIYGEAVWGGFGVGDVSVLMDVEPRQSGREGASKPSGADVEGSAKARTRRANTVSGARAPDRLCEALTARLPRLDSQ
ncbi:hypothetical protein GCM10027287_08310 [Bordetella muralis]